MALSAAGRPAGPAPGDPGRDAVVWHDLECGRYEADLGLWRELAAAAASPPGSRAILEVGAGTGRVALDLARHGHRVTALDIDEDLLGALSRRAAGASVETVYADARRLALGDRRFALCVVAMLTIQLFGGPERRAEFLSRARAHLVPGGLLACAIVTDFDRFDYWAGDPVPSPETTIHEGRLYRSTARMVRERAETIVIVRRREILDPGGPPRDDPDSEPVLDVVRLDRLDAATLAREARATGLAPAGVREVPATDEHVGHEVVLLRA
jgi:SAM-dependent methyltransferase